jgi:hypothetical protein
MRPSFFVRLGIAVCGTLALWLFSAPVADAAPLSRHRTHVIRPWESRPAHRRARIHAAYNRTVRPWVHALASRQRVVLRAVRPRVERRRTTSLPGNDAAALQSNAAALGGEDDQLLASLELLGLLAPAQYRITIKEAIAPRAPRGPPRVTRIA